MKTESLLSIAGRGEGSLTEPLTFLDGRVSLYAGDCREVVRGLADCSIDSVVTDPPYALVSIGKRLGADNAAPAKAGKTGAYARASAGFMGKKWDTGETAFDPDFWTDILRVLKPGGHLISFSGTRTYHRMACAIEDAGFEIRDQIGWAYGSGFPKSHDVSKGIDRQAGAERETIGPNRFSALNGRSNLNVYGVASRPDETAPATDAAIQWQGWGTALKPAWEPVCLARKPLVGTVAANVLRWGTGALNIGATRVGSEGGGTRCGDRDANGKCLGHPDRRGTAFGLTYHGPESAGEEGRWPANVCHDGSDEVVGAFPVTSASPEKLTRPKHRRHDPTNWQRKTGDAGLEELPCYGDSGSAARFFYSAKADADDRLGSKHPTVKPVDLMRYLCRLVTPPGGVVLDPFAGSGTTGEAAYYEGFRAILIEREEEYQADIARRMEACLAGPDERERIANRNRQEPIESMPLFGGMARAGGAAAGLREVRPRRQIGPIGMKKW